MQANTKTKKRQKKIGLLETLINHPRTGAAERAAAERALARLATAAEAEGVAAPTGGWAEYRRVYGAKYHLARNATLTEIAKLMRQDVKLARKIAKQATEPGTLAVPDPIADMPDQIKISITTAYFSGGGSIDIRIKSAPREWGYITAPRSEYDRRPVEQPSRALRDLARELKNIHGAYNHDGSDLTTDHFDVLFYGNVTDEHGRILA